MTDSSPKLGKIFIGGLSYETTDEKLRAYFGAYGSVTDAVVMKDPISRRSRGFGFITYADPACVDRALAQPNHVLDSRRVEAKRAVPRAESNTREPASTSSSATAPTSSNNGAVASSSSNGPNSGGTAASITRTSSSSTSAVSSSVGVVATKKIFVGGLHYETKDADFKKYFEQFGKVVSAEVMFNRETNKSRGFGFVVFEHESSVEHVLQNRNHTIDGKSVEVKRAVPRTDAPPSKAATTRGGSFSGPSTSTSSPNIGASTTPTSSSRSPPGSTNSAENVSTATPKTFSAEEQPRSFAAVANGTLGGYAAAVRYGGRGAPHQQAVSSPNTNSGSAGSSNPNSALAEGMEKVSLDEPTNYAQQPQESYSQERSHTEEQRDAVFQSPDMAVAKSPQQQALNSSPSPSTSSPGPPALNLPQESNAQWSSYSNQMNQYGISGQQSHSQDADQLQSAFQWHQPQWQQWGQSSFSNEQTSEQIDQGVMPQSQQQPPQQPPPPPQQQQQQQQQSPFFSMFGSSMSDSNPNAPNSSSGYRQAAWDSGYGSSSLGMGGMVGMGMMGSGIGIGSNNMSMAGIGGLGLDNGMGSFPMQSRNPLANDPSSSYGFGSGSLGSLQQENYRGHTMETTTMGMGLSSGVNSGSNLNVVKPDGTSDQQQQPLDLDYGKYSNPSTSQFQGYR